MKLLKMSVERFASWTAPVEIDFSQVRMLAVVGPNGAGKSSLFYALRWLLFGRGVTDAASSVIPVGHASAQGTLIFEAAGHGWRVNRTRTMRTASAALYRIDDDMGEEVEAEGVQAVNKRISELLGLSLATFEATVFHPQGDPGRFAAAKPIARKAVLGEILGLERFAPLAKAARDAAREIDRDIKLHSERFSRLQDRLIALPALEDSAAGLSQEMAEARSALEAARNDETQAMIGQEMARQAAKDAQTALAAASEGLKAAEAQRRAAAERAQRIAKAETNALAAGKRAQEALDAAKRAKAGLDAAKAAVVAAEALVSEMDSLSGQATTAVIEAKTRLSDIVARGKEIKSRVEALDRGDVTSCFACARPFAPGEGKSLSEHLNAELSSLREAAVAAKAAVAEAEEAKKAAEAKLAAARERERKAASAFVRMESQAATVPSLEDEVQRYAAEAERHAAERAEATAEAEAPLPPAPDGAAVTAAQDRLREAGKALEAATAALRAAEATAKGIEEALASAQSELAVLRAAAQEADELRQSIEAAAREHKKEALLADAFGPDGIPHLLYAEAVPELEASANELLEQLSDDMRVRLSTAKDDDSGAEALDVEIERGEARRAYESYSGGERFRVDLALGITLGRLVSRRSGEPIRIYAFDEGWGALDEPGVSNTLSALRAVADQFDLVMTVTHHPDAAAGFDATLVVERGPDGSRAELVLLD